MRRDALIQAQLADAERRAYASLREQAEQITLTGFPISTTRPNTAGETSTTAACGVENGSRRPIRNVACRLRVSGQVFQPDDFRIGEPGPSVSFQPTSADAVDMKVGLYRDLLAGQTISVRFPLSGPQNDTPKYVIRFTDDANSRWQLNDNMHLAYALDQEW